MLVLPEISYGVTRYGADFAARLDRRRDAALARDRSARGSSGRARQQPSRAGAGLDAPQTRLPLLGVTRRANAERLTDEFRAGAGHAGDTDLARARRSPDLVDQARMGTLEASMVDMPEAIGQEDELLAMGMAQAYAGAPADAGAEEGEQTFDTLAEMLIELIREVAAA
jgi:creatinine amidohydrolase